MILRIMRSDISSLEQSDGLDPASDTVRAPVFVLVCVEGHWRRETRKIAAILFADVVG